MKTLEVIMPCFNSKPEFFKVAVESVDSARTSLAVVGVKLNLCIVDDASNSESTKKFLSNINKQYSWITVHYLQENHGASGARNYALENTDSEWVAFLDSDDYWLSGGINLLCEHMLKDNTIEWASGDFYIQHSGGDVETQSFYPQNPSRYQFLADAYKTEKPIRLIRPVFEFLEGSLCSMGSCVISKALLQRAGYFDLSLKKGVDTELYWRLAKESDLVFLPQPIFVYRRYEGTLSSDGRRISDWEPEVLEKMLSAPEWGSYTLYLKRRYIRTLMNLSALESESGHVLQALTFSLKALKLRPYGYRVWKNLFDNFVIFLKSKRSGTVA